MAEHDLNAVAFPRLDDAQLTALGRCPHMTRKHFREGEKLFEDCQLDSSIFVVLSGKVEIVDVSGERPNTIVVHERGQITGEVGQLTGRPTLVVAVARGDCEVYEVSPTALRALLNQCPDIGNVILQAFITQRQMLRESGTFTGLQVIGAYSSRDTFRIRDFLDKNGVPYTWVDTEANPQVNQLLQRFGVTESETPVVGWGNKLILRNPSNRQLADATGLPPSPGAEGIRPGDRWGRTGGTGRRRLRLVGRARHGGPGARRTGRSGRPEYAD